MLCGVELTIPSLFFLSQFKRHFIFRMFHLQPSTQVLSLFACILSFGVCLHSSCFCRRELPFSIALESYNGRAAKFVLLATFPFLHPCFFSSRYTVPVRVDALVSAATGHLRARGLKPGRGELLHWSCAAPFPRLVVCISFPNAAPRPNKASISSLSHN